MERVRRIPDRGDPAESLATVLAYHERTKHHPGRFARSLGHLDWATQPDPFRRFAGAPVLSLELVPFEDHPRYEPAFFLGNVPPVPLGRRWVSHLFQDSLALSAWKQAGAARWSLRVNPSSGNLHPTEGYLIAGLVEGLADKPAVYHYAPHEHALERRVDLSDETWAALAARLDTEAHGRRKADRARGLGIGGARVLGLRVATGAQLSTV